MVQERRPATIDKRAQVRGLSGIAQTIEPLALDYFAGLRYGATPADVYNARRFDNLGFLRPFLTANASDPAISAARAVLDNLRAKNEPAGNLVVGENPLRDVNPALFDQFEETSLALESLFQVEDIRKRDELVRLIRQQTDESTRANLEEIDARAERGESRVRKKVIIVGGGLLTSVATTFLAHAGIDTTVITDSDIGEPWLNQPIFINSDAKVVQFGGADLPLVEGSTTPLKPSFQNNALGADALLNAPGNVLSVECDDPQRPIRQYVEGTGLGALAATNIIAATSDIIKGQKVDASRVRVNSDGSKTIVMQGRMPGETEVKERELDGDLVLFLTGPGKEKFGIKDESTRAAYERGVGEFRLQLQIAQQQIDAYDRRIDALKTGSLRGDRSEEISRLEQERDAITVDLPRILSFTLAKEAYGFWVRNGRRNPSPFLSLLGVDGQEVSHAIAGGGDTGLVEGELIRALGPDSAYPIGFDRSVVNTRLTLFNPPKLDADDFRVRYQRLFKGLDGEGDEKVATVPGVKVLSAAAEQDRVLVRTSDGRTTKSDYLWVSTGLEESPVPNLLKQALGEAYGIVSDIDGRTVALGNADVGVLVAGSATNFTAKDFPPDLRALIDAIGIRENTISDWVNALQLQRCLASLGLQGQLPQPTRVDIRSSVPTRPARPDEREIVERLMAGYGRGGLVRDVLSERGRFTGQFEEAKERLTAIVASQPRELQDPSLIIPILEAVGNTVKSTDLMVDQLLVGAEVAAKRIPLGDAGRFFTEGLSFDQQISRLYGYFAGGLSVANVFSINALEQVAIVEGRKVTEVIDEVLPVINQLRAEREDLNIVPDITKASGKAVRPIDDRMNDYGYYWNPAANGYELTDVRKYTTDIDDLRIVSLVDAKRRAFSEVLTANTYSLEQLRRYGDRGSEQFQKRAEAVESNMNIIGQQLVAEALSEDSGLLINQIVERRLDGLENRIKAGVDAALENRFGFGRLENVVNFGGFSSSQLADFFYGYFAGAIAIDRTGFALDALKTAAFYSGRSEREVIERQLPLIAEARKLRSSGLSGQDDDDFRRLENDLSRYGFQWDSRAQQYVSQRQ